MGKFTAIIGASKEAVSRGLTSLDIDSLYKIKTLLMCDQEKYKD